MTNQENKDNDIPQTGGLAERLKRVKTTRWIRFGIVSVIFFAWVAWLGNWWVALAWLLLCDIYLTQFIPWTWWKHSKNKAVKTVMSWVDAIVYALVLVYFIFAFLGQNYQIPSSSLEKTLLTGDFLWVNKVLYGPRVPQTPLHFPLTQNTLPILDCKSYFDKPQLEYHRLKGWRKVERGDIVVFNFPAGDTVALKVQNPDYYTLAWHYGADRIKNDPATFGEVIYRPVDRRENYVKRCVGLPGDRLMIKNDTIYINGEPLPEPKHIQYNYLIQSSSRAPISEDVWEQLGVAVSDRNQVEVNGDDLAYLLTMGFNYNGDGSVNPVYISPLTYEARDAALKMPEIGKVVKLPASEMMPMYPIWADYRWSRSNYATNVRDGGILIPKRGTTLLLNSFNLPIYRRCIVNYEGNTLDVAADGTISINGEVTDRYTFKMDYYWMQGDNRDNSADSRYWGFVPEDHIVGSPMFILVSLDKDKPMFGGKIRWNRVFRDANPDK